VENLRVNNDKLMQNYQNNKIIIELLSHLADKISLLLQ